MNETRNRDKPASQLTKREEAALRIAQRSSPFIPKGVTDEEFAAAVVRLADSLFDALDTPAELRDDFDHEGTP